MPIEKSEVKRIVCLANSDKKGGRCIAGKELINDQPAGWIRPVSIRPDEEVSEQECRYENGGCPQLLDIIYVPLLKKKPKPYQQENWLLDAGSCWRKDVCMYRQDLESLIDPVGHLWLNGCETFYGSNDKIPGHLVNYLENSLRFIRVNKLTLSVVIYQYGARRWPRVQGKFHYNGERYHLWVTDPKCKNTYLKKPHEDHEINNVYLTVSLAESNDRNYYKLIVAVITRDETGRT